SGILCPSLSLCLSVSLLLLSREPPSSTLFPYTTLFRSEAGGMRGVLAPRNRIDDLGLLLALHHDKIEFENRKLVPGRERGPGAEDRKSTRLNSSHVEISYAVFCLNKKMIRFMRASGSRT